MRRRIALFWERLASSFWFLPILMTAASIALAMTSIGVDNEGAFLPGVESWIWSVRPESAQLLLSIVATSTISVAGVVFSITIVVLTLASSQYGPRLVKNFMHDRWTQFALGSFVSSFTYCVFTLSALRTGTDWAYTPRLTVVVTLALVILDVGVLIIFIHNIAVAIQASTVIQRVFRELEAIVASTLLNPQREDAPVPDADPERTTPITAHATGNVRSIDTAGLVDMACKLDGVVVLDVKPGSFLIEDAEVGYFVGVRDDSEIDSGQLASKLSIGPDRSLTQDCEFALEQLVEIALRALSPGINDPHTALECIDYLGAALSKPAAATLPSGVYRDPAGVPRLFIPTVTFSGLLDSAFNEIRQHSRGNVSVNIRLLEQLERLAPKATETALRSILEHADLLSDNLDERITAPRDLDDLKRRYQRARLAAQGTAP